jgi:hypothetical protein
MTHLTLTATIEVSSESQTDIIADFVARNDARMKMAEASGGTKKVEAIIQEPTRSQREAVLRAARRLMALGATEVVMTEVFVTPPRRRKTARRDNARAISQRSERSHARN